MPLSFGLLFGLMVIVVGAILYPVTRRKKVSVVLVAVGAVVALLTLAALMLAASSNM